MQILFDWMYKLVQGLGMAVYRLLPQSPFTEFINNWNPPQYIGWLNWFFPVGQILSILSLWLTAIGVFYLYSIIMRWVKIIGD